MIALLSFGELGWWIPFGLLFAFMLVQAYWDWQDDKKSRRK